MPGPNRGEPNDVQTHTPGSVTNAIAGIRDGKDLDEATKLIFKRYFTVFSRMAVRRYNLDRRDADEIVNDAIGDLVIALSKQTVDFKNRRRLGAWFRTVVRNAVTKFHRHRERLSQVESLDDIAIWDDVETDPLILELLDQKFNDSRSSAPVSVESWNPKNATPEDHAKALAAIARILTPRQRVIVFDIMVGCNLRDIAEHLGTTEVAAEVALENTRASIKRTLEKAEASKSELIVDWLEIILGQIDGVLSAHRTDPLA